MDRKGISVEYAARFYETHKSRKLEIQIPEDSNGGMTTDRLKRMLFDQNDKLIPSMEGTIFHKLYLKMMKQNRNNKDGSSTKVEIR